MGFSKLFTIHKKIVCFSNSVQHTLLFFRSTLYMSGLLCNQKNQINQKNGVKIKKPEYPEKNSKMEVLKQ